MPETNDPTKPPTMSEEDAKVNDYTRDFSPEKKKAYEAWYAQQVARYGPDPNKWTIDYSQAGVDPNFDTNFEYLNAAQRAYDQGHGNGYYAPPTTLYFDAASGTFSAGSWNGQQVAGYNGPFKAPDAGYTGYTEHVTTRDPVGNPWQNFAKVGAIFVATIVTGGAISSFLGAGGAATGVGAAEGAGTVAAGTGAGAGTAAGVGAGAGAGGAAAAGGSTLLPAVTVTGTTGGLGAGGALAAGAGLTGGAAALGSGGAGAAPATTPPPSTTLPEVVVNGAAPAAGSGGLIDAAGGLTGLGGAVSAGSSTPAAQPNYTQPGDTPPGEPQPQSPSGVGGLLSRANQFLGSPTGQILTGIGGQVLQGIAGGKAAEAEQEAINERARYYDNQWRDPAQVQALKNAVVEAPKVSTGYLDRAQRISDFLSNSRRTPGDPNKVYGTYVRGE